MSREAAESAPANGPPGDRRTQGSTRHGFAVPRGQTLLPGRGGSFGRMFGFLPRRDPGHDATEALFALMKALPASESNSQIPAGYTYLGQFIDHDMTFDPTSVLGRDNDPRALVNARTARFDLDSLYGSGPQDQPFLYDWEGEHRGAKLLVGHNREDASLPAGEQPASVDLPRNQQFRALIGDPRNDENLIVSQLHLLFIHFHNKVVDQLSSKKLAGSSLFEEARRVVRWHYQWIVVHDFLEHLVGTSMAHNVLQPRPQGEAPVIARRFYTWQDEPFVPVEFSVAAFRCGHSMVRDEYRPKTANGRTFPILPARSGRRKHFGGFRRLPDALAIDWDRLFPILDANAPTFSLRIDTRITEALFRLPPDDTALPRLNLQRSRALGLPAGRDVARAMGLQPLSAEELGLDDPALCTGIAEALIQATPLWYYILCEAATRNNGQFLGPLGGRIVAEVLVGLLEGDPQSYLRQWPAWRPHLPAEKRGDFTMPDLVRFVHPDLDDA